MNQPGRVLRKCVEGLLDKSADEGNRLAAAESLEHFPGTDAVEALFRVVTDPGESKELREEAAGSLATIWCEIGVDHEKLVRIPPPFLDEVVCDFDLAGVRLDPAGLGSALAAFRERYGNRTFMR